MSNILSRLGISPVVLRYFSPYLQTLTENSAVFLYQDSGCGQDLEIFQERQHVIPDGTTAWTVHSPFSPAVRQHFFFYSALESLCFFSLHPGWLDYPAHIAISAIGLLPEQNNVIRLLTAFPNAQLHLAFGNDLPGRIMDCQIALWQNQQYWHFAYHHGRLHMDDGQQTFSITAEKFSSSCLLMPGTRRRFKKQKPRGGCTSFYEQLNYP